MKYIRVMDCDELKRRTRLMCGISDKIGMLHDIIEADELSKEEILAMVSGLHKLSKCFGGKLMYTVNGCRE